MTSLPTDKLRRPLPGQPLVKVPIDAVYVDDDRDCCYVLQSALPSPTAETVNGRGAVADECRAAISRASSAPAGADGWQWAPKEPTDEMLERALDANEERIMPFTAPRESGVALECDITEEDAAEFNASIKAAHRHTYCAMLAAAPSILAEESTKP